MPAVGKVAIMREARPLSPSRPQATRILLCSSKCYNKFKEKIDKIHNLITVLKKDYATEYEKIKHYEQDIIRIQNAVAYLNEIMETVNIPHFVDSFNKSIQDIKTYEAKLKGDVLELANKELKIKGEEFKKRILSLNFIL